MWHLHKFSVIREMHFWQYMLGFIGNCTIDRRVLRHKEGKVIWDCSQERVVGVNSEDFASYKYCLFHEMRG